MQREFGQIPPRNPNAASDIADAARHVEQLLQNEQGLDVSSDTDPFPRPGIDVPGVGEAEVVVEDVDISSIPVEPGKDGDSHDGTVGRVVEGGFEYLAFYKSPRDVMRAPAPKRWGIFLIKRRCMALATDMRLSTGEPFADCLDGLAAFLYAHELYHYRLDAHYLQMEASGGQALYRPYCRLVSGRPMAEWHEESIANYYGLKAVRPSLKSIYARSIYDYLFDLVANSPGAYAGGVDKQQKQRKDLIVQQASAVFSITGTSAWQGLMESTIRIGTSLSIQREPSLGSFLRLENCPVYWIDWIKGGKSVLRPYVASVSEVNNDFIRRYLAGVQNHHSDHSYCRIDNGEMVKLPNPHRADVTKREFHNIIGKAGMTSSQFYKERIRTSLWRKDVPREPVLPPRRGT